MRREMWIRADPSTLAEARAFADEAATALGFPDELRFQFTLAAHEAVANAIEHGAPCEGGKIELSVEEVGDTLHFSVRDCGSFLPNLDEPEALPERGRGLAFIAVLMDEVDLKPTRNSTIVRISKRIPRRAACWRSQPAL